MNPISTISYEDPVLIGYLIVLLVAKLHICASKLTIGRTTTWWRGSYQTLINCQQSCQEDALVLSTTSHLLVAMGGIEPPIYRV